MNFLKDYPVENLLPASYNPRKMETPNFELLKQSLTRFGVVKPLIVNGDLKILTAGHHRTKALKELNIETCPVFVLPSITKQDEIQFNMFHNAVESNITPCIIRDSIKLPFGYSIVSEIQIQHPRPENAYVVTSIGKLLMKYGAWGSVVIDEEGNCVANSDYAVATKQLKQDLLIYKLHTKDVKDFLYYISQDYGEYYYEALGVKSYNQTYTQPHRGAANSERQFESTIYKNNVIPKMTKDTRLLDFGSGESIHALRLRDEGFKAFMYEPYFRFKGSGQFDIKQIVNWIKEIYFDVKDNGLYDIVILDSVINSVSDSDFEHCVMTVCNSLLRGDGEFVTQTRCTKMIENHKNLKQARSSNRRLIEFTNKDGFSATFRQGVWTLQKFHSKDTLSALLTKYFHEVRIFDEETTYIKAICKKPIRLSLDEYERCLDKEFNMLYPSEYRHNKQAPLVKAVLERHYESTIDI